MQFTADMAISSMIFIIAYIIIVTDRIDRVIVALGGGILMVLVRLLEQDNAFEAIDFNTLGLLISMMVIVMITQRTGVFEYLSIKMVKLAGGEPRKILALLSLITAVTSAFLDNVTTILLILPITIDVCKELRLKPVPFIIAQIFASNIGGTATLIGDPPNIMIGTKAGLGFMDFIYNVAPAIVPILAFSILAFLFIYRKTLHTKPEFKQKILLMNESEAIKDKKLLVKSLIMLGLTIIGFIFHGSLHYESSTVAMAGAVMLLLISGIKPERVLKEVEWKTIFFFAGLFMLVGGIEQAGVLKYIANGIHNFAGNDMVLLTMSILWTSAIVSAFVDNIPFTATMIPLIKDIGAIGGIPLGPLWWALSLGACLGGNGTIIGASANVIASGMAEESGHKITFAAYFRACFPVMLITVALAAIYLLLFYLR
jgi:Na+/H+ antiporter NhaD/arsenite permease-like protein